jgi:chitinase
MNALGCFQRPSNPPALAPDFVTIPQPNLRQTLRHALMGMVLLLGCLGLNLSAGAAVSVSWISPLNLSYPLALSSTPLILTANASSTTGSISKVDFYNGTVLLGTVTSPPYRVSWSNIPLGNYTLSAQATDAAGMTASSTPVIVFARMPPVVSLNSPVANARLLTATSLTLFASASSASNPIRQVDFYATSLATNVTTLIATDSIAPYSAVWISTTPGNYTLTARATAATSLMTTSSPVAVEVVDALVTLTSPVTHPTAPATVPLTALISSAFPVSQVDFYATTVVSNVTTLIGTSTGVPFGVIWTNAPTGNYRLTVVVRHTMGRSATYSVGKLLVFLPPSVVFTTPFNNSAVTATNDLSLVATATSANLNNGVVKVGFYNGATLLGEVQQQGATTVATAYSWLWKSVPAGIYTLTAQATDSLGGIATSAPVTLTAGNPQVYFIHNDHLNTPRLITDTQARVVWRWDNTSPFGNNPPNENPAGLGRFVFNQRFAGQYFDQETGLNYNHFRDGYSPSLGGYSQSDPIGLQGGQVSTFGYVGGNPVSRNDPTGEVSPMLLLGLSAAITFRGIMETANTLYNFYSDVSMQTASQKVLSAAQSACNNYPNGGACGALQNLQQQANQCTANSVQSGSKIPGTLATPKFPNTTP